MHSIAFVLSNHTWILRDGLLVLVPEEPADPALSFVKKTLASRPCSLLSLKDVNASSIYFPYELPWCTIEVLRTTAWSQTHARHTRLRAHAGLRAHAHMPAHARRHTPLTISDARTHCTLAQTRVPALEHTFAKDPAISVSR